MITVRQILRDKGSSVWTISSEASVYSALELMAEKNIGAVVVVEEGSVAGIFSERDYARLVALQGRDSREISVGDLMTQEVMCVTPETKGSECMALMTEHHIRHLPVLDEGALCGIVSIGDVVNTVISMQKTTINDLERFISGRGYGAQV